MGKMTNIWLIITVARQRGKSLPPVQLIQVWDVCFCQNGHYRISVARALGQRDIEAEVTVWQVNGPFPWEEPATALRYGYAQTPC
jgi:hypothetical protein